MSNNDGDEYVLKLRADVSGAKADLRAINDEIAAIKQNYQTAFGKSIDKPFVQRPIDTTRPGSDATADARNDALLRGELQRLRGEADRLKAAAPTTPATATAAAHAAARAAKTVTPPGTGTGAPGKPVEITANDAFYDRLARANAKSGLSSAAMQAAGGRISSVSGLLSLVGGLAGTAGPGGLAAAGAVLGGRAALAVSDQQATVQRQVALLASSLTGGPSMGNPLGMASDIRNQGQAFNYGADQAMKIASDLALAGVGRANLVGSVGATAMLARRSGGDPGQLTSLTSTLAVQGGMGHEQINSLFQDLGNLSDAAGGSGPSLLRLIDSLKALQSQTAGASVSLSGLAAVSKILGPSYNNVGAMFAPAVGASGTNQLQQASLLGVSPDAYSRMQKNPAQLYDAIGRFVKQVDPKGGQQGADVAEQVLSQTGLVNLSSLSPDKQRQFIDDLRAGKTNAAATLAGHLGDQARKRRVSEQQALATTARTTAGQTGLRDRAGIALDNRITQTFNPDPQQSAAGYRNYYALSNAMSYNIPSDVLTQQAAARNTPATPAALHALAVHDRRARDTGDSWGGVAAGGGFTGGDSGSWGGAASAPPREMRITVVVQDQNGRTMGNARASTQIDPDRRLTGARTWGPTESRRPRGYQGR